MGTLLWVKGVAYTYGMQAIEGAAPPWRNNTTRLCLARNQGITPLRRPRPARCLFYFAKQASRTFQTRKCEKKGPAGGDGATRTHDPSIPRGPKPPPAPPGAQQIWKYSGREAKAASRARIPGRDLPPPATWEA